MKNTDNNAAMCGLCACLCTTHYQQHTTAKSKSNGKQHFTSSVILIINLDPGKHTKLASCARACIMCDEYSACLMHATAAFVTNTNGHDAAGSNQRVNPSHHTLLYAAMT